MDVEQGVKDLIYQWTGSDEEKQRIIQVVIDEGGFNRLECLELMDEASLAPMGFKFGKMRSLLRHLKKGREEWLNNQQSVSISHSYSSTDYNSDSDIVFDQLGPTGKGRNASLARSANPATAVQPFVLEIASPTEESEILRFFSSKHTDVPPAAYVVGQKPISVQVDENRLRSVIECTAYRRPLRAVLKNFFSGEKVLSTTLKHMTHLASQEKKVSFVQGSYWQTGLAQDGITRNGKITIPFLLYFHTEFNTGFENDTSTIPNIKLGGVYLSFPTVAAHLPSGEFLTPHQLHRLIPLCLFRCNDRASFGNAAIFGPIIEEMNEIYREGIYFQLGDYTGRVYFHLGLLVGNTKALHSVCGFDESFSTNRCCRDCRITYGGVEDGTEERPELLRNPLNYIKDLEDGDVAESGIKEESIWLDVEGFDVLGQTGVDCIQNVFKGVARYIMAFIIKQFLGLRYFSIADLNERIDTFEYGPDHNDKPYGVTEEEILNEKLTYSAIAMLTLIRYFGLIVGDTIPREENGEKDELWELYLKLNRLMYSITSNTSGRSDVMQHDIKSLYEDYIRLTGRNLGPKFHFLLHYPRSMKKFGPLSLISTMRFAGQHRPCATPFFVHTFPIFIDKQFLCKTSKHRFLYKRYLSLLTPLRLSCKLEELLLAKTLLYDDYLYKRGTVLFTHVCSHTNADQFLVIDWIVSDEMYNNVLVIGTSFRNSGYDEHVAAHKVVKTRKQGAYFFKDLVSRAPCNVVSGKSGDLYVVMR